LGAARRASFRLSLFGVAASVLTYAWAATRTPWWISLPVSWACFAATALLVQRVPASATAALVAALASFVLATVLLPRAGAHAAAQRPAWDLPLRVIASMAMVVSVTA